MAYKAELESLRMQSLAYSFTSVFILFLPMRQKDLHLGWILLKKSASFIIHMQNGTRMVFAMEKVRHLNIIKKHMEKTSLMPASQICLRHRNSTPIHGHPSLRLFMLGM